MAPKIKTLAGFILCFVCLHGQAQMRRPFGEEVAFLHYLQQKDLFQEAITAINEIDIRYLSLAQIDTLHYLRGWSFYNIKKLDSSAYYLSRVNEASPYYLKSRFFSAYNYIYLEQYTRAMQILQTLPDTNLVKEARSFEQSGIMLLKHDYEKFDSLKQYFSYKSYVLSAQEKSFLGYKDQLMRIGKKSPFLAAVMSGIVPGSGKIYAGKTLQGIASMLPIAALALLTSESYHKRGPHSAEFYVFGSLLTVFYVGNIWGSVFAVKINREEHEKLIHQKVLLDLQIPLRTLFN